jgi:hypothetical protein
MSEETDDVEHIDIDDVWCYEDKYPSGWKEELTVTLPSLPCNSHIILQSIVNLANKYEIAYNAFTDLMVICSQAEAQFKREKYRLCSEQTAEYVRRNVKVSKENVETIVMNKEENTKLRKLQDRYLMYEMIRDFFENHKTKLEKTMFVANGLSYSTNARDRVEYKGNI